MGVLYEREHFSFFQNGECEYFPCHHTSSPEQFNCLFCYCPLYMLDEKCGGNFTYTESGYKDCSNCMIPHGEGGYDYVVERCMYIVEQMAEKHRDSYN